MSQTYRANDNHIYLPQDFLQASFVMEADGKGKMIRKILKSDKPIVMRSMVELYLVDSDFLTKEAAKQEYKDKHRGMRIEAPATVPPLNAATRKLVERARTEAKKR